jgi:hypothetical protein
MTVPWPPRATEEERSLRLFKDALMRRSMSAVGALLSPEGEEDLHRRTAEVEDAYARVSERAPEELKGDAAPTYAQVLTALRTKGKGREEALPPRRVLVHILARLDYYFFELASGHERVHDMPYLTNEERAAEHGLRYDLFLKLYDELEPAFDVSLNWPPGGYEVDEDGELLKIEAEFEGMAAIGYDYGYDAAIFHEGHADDEEYVRGFVEGCLERLVDQDEPEEADYLGSLWENGDEEDKRHALEMLKDGCEVREGRFDDRPEFPV